MHVFWRGRRSMLLGEVEMKKKLERMINLTVTFVAKGTAGA